MLPLGWFLMQLVSLLTGMKPLERPWVKTARRVLVIVLVVLELVLVPYMVFLCEAMVQTLTRDSVHLSIWLGPVMYWLQFRLRKPSIYWIPGAALWLFGVPKPRKKKTATENTAAES